MVAFVTLAGLVVTGAAGWIARSLDRDNERSLLKVQTRQAADVIGSAIAGIVNPLQTALAVEAATGGDPGDFERFMAAFARPGGLFDTASLWRGGGGGAAAAPPPRGGP